MRKRKRLAVTVAGVAVSVHLDDQGRPLSAHAGIERPGDLDHERVVTLAATRAIEAALSGWQGAKRKGSSDKAAVASAQSRAKAADEHWTNEYFKRAHAAQPSYGRERLAQLARSEAAKDYDKGKRDLTPKKRDEITPARAQQFLKRQRNAPH
jgi:hypothetical protein